MSNDTYDAAIRQLATELRLGPAILKFYKETPFTEPGEYVHSLLKAIWDKRTRDRILRQQKATGINLSKTLDSFDTACLELPKGVELSWFTDCHFIEAQQNLILLGNPGTGKTHLACALGAQACSKGHKVSFRRLSSLVAELESAFEAGDLKKVMRRYGQLDLLILDEWGYLPTNVTGTRLLFDLIADSYERRSVLLTTNLPMPEWNRIFCDERLVLAMIDRLAHHGYLVKHTGESYRITHSLMATKG